MKRAMTLKTRFILTSYCSIVISVFLICIVSYVLLGNLSRKFAIQANQEAVRQKNEDISGRVNGIEVTIRDIIYNSELQKLLNERNMEEGQESKDVYGMRMAVNSSIARASSSLYMIDNIAVFAKDGSMIGSLYEFNTLKKSAEYSWFEKMDRSKGETVWLSDTIHKSRDNYGYHMTISAVKKIRSISSMDGSRMGEELGCVYFTVNLDGLLNFEQEYTGSEDRKMMVVNERYQIIGGTDDKKNGTTFKTRFLKNPVNNMYIINDDQKELFTYGKLSQNMNWYIICMVPEQSILKNFYMSILICAVISVLLLIGFLLVSLRNAESISRPVRLLEKKCELVAKGHFDIRNENSGILEIDRLFTRFKDMAEQLDNLIHKVYEAKIKEQSLIAESRQAQMQALQMQINPHFLYNTLDSINWMALMAGNEEVSEMILALGQLFRSNMNTSGIYAKVSNAVENVRLYMYLQQVRFEEGLEYQIEVEDDVKDAMILKNLIQPLVENSIKHGIEPWNIKGSVHISIKKSGDLISLAVQDNGHGIAKEQLDHLRQQWKDIDKEEEEGNTGKGSVGLRNIMRRLWLCYGSKASFVISSNKEKGTSTLINFPLEYQIVQINEDTMKKSD